MTRGVRWNDMAYALQDSIMLSIIFFDDYISIILFHKHLGYIAKVYAICVCLNSWCTWVHLKCFQFSSCFDLNDLIIIFNQTWVYRSFLQSFYVSCSAFGEFQIIFLLYYIIQWKRFKWILIFLIFKCGWKFILMSL